jgi:hypothetical protein
MSRSLSNFKEKKNKQKSQGDEDFEEQESLRHVVVQIAAGTSLRLVVVFVVYIAAAGADVVHMAAGLLRLRNLAIPSIVATNFLLKTQPTEIASKFEEPC